MGDTLWKKEEFEDIRNLLYRSQRGLEILGETNQNLKKLLPRLVGEKGAMSMVRLLEIRDRLAHSQDCKPITQAGYINTNKESEKDRMSQVYE